MTSPGLESLRGGSRFSSIEKVKPSRLQNESKSKYCWRLIRSSVRDAIDVMKKADIHDIIVGHGVHHGRKLNHPEPLLDIVFNKNSKEYLTLDTKFMRVFRSDGRKKDIVTPQRPFDRFLHAEQSNLYVGWMFNSDKLYLMNSELEVVSESTAPGNILAAAYNENINEVVTVGSGCLTSWVFRYGGRHLLPRKTSHDGVTNQDIFTLLVLEETASRTQKCFAACNTGVAMFNLFEGKLLSYEKNLHTRTISAMTFFNPLKYLVTGARDGTIKVWDETWHLQLVFVGHGDCVNSLAVFPYGPHIISSSEDCTIRVWSLETCDEVDKVKTADPVYHLGTLINQDKFYSMSAKHADLWQIQHIHTLHTTVGHKVQSIKSTDHPSYPIRSVLLCRDSSVRIVSPVSGEVITTLLQHPKRNLLDAAYAIAEDTLFAVFGDGTILKCDTSTNPCTVKEEWSCPDPKKGCNYLLVYEYVISADIEGDVWGGMQRAIATKSLATGQGPVKQQKSNNRTLLLGGRKDGHICVFDWDSGEVEFEIEAHGSKGVLSMVANSKADQLISAGLDNIIKLWRLYPYAQESLAPLMTFYCAHTPIHMSIMRNKLAVAFQEHTTATYSVVLYNLNDKNRYDHTPEEDHMDSITGLDCCPKMKLFASASHDGTVRVWNEANNIVRLIKLNVQPSSLAFCSQRGDLLVGIGNHLHKVSYKTYMPKAHRFKMISMGFPREVEEKALPFNEDLLNRLHKEDVKRLKASHSSFKYTHFVDILTEEETEEVMREKKLREKAFALIDQRESELCQIRDGDLQAKIKPRSTPATKRTAFDRYLKIFYSRPEIEAPKDDPYETDTVKEMLKPKPVEVEEERSLDTGPPGFFPSPASALQPKKKKKKLRKTEPESIEEEKPEEVKEEEVKVTEDEVKVMEEEVKPEVMEEIEEEEEEEEVEDRLPPLPINPTGFIPNSVLVRLLWPQRVIEEAVKKQEEAYRPPQLSEDQLKEIAGTKQGPSRVLILDYEDEEPAKEDAEEIKEKEEKEKEKEKKQTESKSKTSSYLEKLQSVLDKPPTPPRSPSPTEVAEEKKRTPDIPRADTSMSQESRESRRRSITSDLQPIKKKAAPRPMKPIVKYVAPKALPPSSPPRRTRPMTPETTRTPTPPPTPLPGFITQFKGTEWFEKYFPNCNENTMPKPWTASAFVSMLVRVLKIAEFKHKTPVAEALMNIHQNEGITNNDSVYKAVMTVLNHHSNPPSCQNEEQKEFIITGLQLLYQMGIYDKEFYTELICQFLDGDKDVRNTVMELIKGLGLRDPHNYFTKELDSWDTWSLDEKTRKKELMKMADAWLEKWMATFKIHIEDSIERLKKGETVRGHVSQGDLRPPGRKTRGILKSSGVEREESSAQVTFDVTPDIGAVENATYIEALNYFCEMELEKSLERMKGGAAGTKAGEHKNTVLVFPKLTGKQTLVRLGETHTSHCRPQRETALADFKLPPITTRGRQPEPGQLYGFAPCINLPMKTVYMNPFPCPLDAYDPIYQEPVLLTLKTSQKYFVPSRSHVPEYC